MTALVLALALSASAAPAPEAGSPSAYAELVSLNEGGKLTRGGKPLKAGAVLRFGETLELSGGRATLKIREEGHVLVKGRSTFTIGKPKEPGFLLQRGAMLMILEKLRRGGFRVRTPQIIAAVRGTHYYVEARPQDSYLCVCQGEVEVSETDGDLKHAVASDTHESRVYRRHPKSGLMHSAEKMLGHTDDERVELHDMQRGDAPR